MEHSLPRTIRETIRRKALLERGDNLIVAFSGGADSTALLAALAAMREELGIQLFAFHLNHMLRGEEADRDQHFAEETCEALGVRLRVRRVDVGAAQRAWDVSFEEAGRTVRYRELDQWRESLEKETGCRTLCATAHHRGDVAETFLMNLLRGSGVDGLASIAYRSGPVIRPMLSASRAEIEDYLRSLGMSWCEDSTNRSDRYRRNHVRTRLIPYIESEYEVDAVGRIFAATERLKEDRAFFESHIEELAKTHVTPPFGAARSYRIARVGALHEAEVGRLIRRVFCQLLGTLKDVTSRDVLAVRELSQVGTVLELRGGLRVRKTYDGLVISRSSAGEAFEDESGEGDGTRLHIREFASDEIDRSALALGEKAVLIDADKVAGALRVRRRKPGDRFTPLGMTGSKLLRKLLIDEKIDRDRRDRIRIVEDDEKIVWVEGVRMSEAVKVDEETKRLLMLTFR